MRDEHHCYDSIPKSAGMKHPDLYGQGVSHPQTLRYKKGNCSVANVDALCLQATHARYELLKQPRSAEITSP
jgi:hypothetical protein